MWRLIRGSVSYHWEAHCSTPANLIAAIISMTLNNILFIIGMWLVIFAGKDANRALLPYFLCAWAISATVWGLLNFFSGGLSSLGQMIEEGNLDTVMATPRPPLLLLGLSASHPPALGDVIQGILTFAAVGWFGGIAFMFRGFLMVPVAYFAFMATFIGAGSLAFFLPRGASLAGIMIESTLAFSTYPSGRMFEGSSRVFLYLTPALVTSVLPLEFVDHFTIANLLVAVGASFVTFSASVALFAFGAKRYRSGSHVTLTR